MTNSGQSKPMLVREEERERKREREREKARAREKERKIDRERQRVRKQQYTHTYSEKCNDPNSLKLSTHILMSARTHRTSTKMGAQSKK